MQLGVFSFLIAHHKAPPFSLVGIEKRLRILDDLIAKSEEKLAEQDVLLRAGQQKLKQQDALIKMGEEKLMHQDVLLRAGIQNLEKQNTVFNKFENEFNQLDAEIKEILKRAPKLK